ncbi:MAG TPA: tetratricopeptide repeat protein [Chthoniobacterales bacterium]|nr:tetratricopeptide repeat protein [Chthoniobacterales bacterium]
MAEIGIGFIEPVVHHPVVQGRPVGTVTFLFTDMEGSTRAWEEHPVETQRALAQHDEIVAREVKANNGAIILERGEGDSVFAVFARPSDAVAAACEIQRSIRNNSWPAQVPMRVRMAIHTGEAGADYRGPHVNRAARMRSIAHGEQVLISGVTAGIVRNALPNDAWLIDLGQHRLRDVIEMEHVYQLAHPELRQDFPPVKSLTNFRQNLPVQLTSFVGRESERDTIRDLVRSHRVVTLVGPGGSGKTRLAIQVGGDLLEEFPDGVRFADLAPVNDASLVMGAIADSIGAKSEHGVSAGDLLIRSLQGTRTLVILDNCEHVTKSCAEAVSILVRSGDGVRILATSREPLGLAGEMKWRVPPLGLPEKSSSFDEIAHAGAVQLFVDRAVAARDGFVFSRANAAVVSEICQVLEGIPLAIELAAARTKALSPQEIRDRLKDRFRLLIGGHGRHGTLRSTIDWSYELLSGPERSLFRRLSVFAGGFDLAAAGAVWPEGDPLDHIEHLVDKSLVTVEQLDHDKLRYRMLETLRQYGADRLNDIGETNQVREQHFTHYLQLAEHAYARRIEEEAASLSALAIDHDDFRAALAWARSDPKKFLRLASALGWFWHLCSNYAEGRRWLEEALRLNPDDRSRETARALWALSMILSWQGEADLGRSLAEKSLQLWRETDDALELALASEGIGYSQFMAGRYAEALRSMEDCLAAYEKLGSAKLATRGRINVGQMLVALGDVERTEPLARQTLEEGRAQNEPKFIHYSLHYLGDCALWRGDAAAAVGIYAESLRAALDYGNEMEVAIEMQGMSMGLAGSGKEVEALQLYGASCARNDELQTSAADEIAFWVELRRRYLSPARDRLGKVAADKAEAEGRAMVWERAVAFAFECSRKEALNIRE